MIVSNEIIFLSIVLLTVIFLALRQLSRGDAPAAEVAYRRNPKFLSPAEVAFYQALTQGVSDQFLIFAKVRLFDLIEPVDGPTYRARRNKVIAKHVDFVLCDRERHQAVAVVELDDASHYQAKAIARDEFVDSALRSAGIPTIRFRWRNDYNSTYIRQCISESLTASSQ